MDGEDGGCLRTMNLCGSHVFTKQLCTPCHCSWLDRADERAFDLVVIYYGRGRDFHCEECSGVFSMRGAKWHLVKALMGSTDWAALSGGYEAVMLADDDLVMSTHGVFVVGWGGWGSGRDGWTGGRFLGGGLVGGWQGMGYDREHWWENGEGGRQTIAMRCRSLGVGAAVQQSSSGAAQRNDVCRCCTALSCIVAVKSRDVTGSHSSTPPARSPCMQC